MPAVSKRQFAYAGLLGGVFVLAITASWTPLGTRIDDSVYDWFFHLYQPQPWPAESIVLAFDENSFRSYGGVLGFRKMLADGLERIASAAPKAVAVDPILADTADRESDSRLESAFRATRNLILSCDLLPDKSAWEDPLPGFQRWAVAVGHVHLDPDNDGVGRELGLEKAVGHDRRWALALQAFRVSRGAGILETPQDLEVGNVRIPAANSTGRVMRIHYRTANMAPIPVITLKQLHDDPTLAQKFAGKVVFAGVTAQTATKDRWIAPLDSIPIAGILVHASAFETIAQQRFLTSASALSVVAFCLFLTVAAGAAFTFFWGWAAYVLAAVILALAHAVPYAAFTRNVVFPYSPGVSTAWLSIVAAALWQHFYVRRRLVKSEAERDRYQHTMHFVTHEMRTPLTAIQGSSELMSRYPMPEEKRKQVAQLIHSESKRLGRMIEMFLNVERLSAGEMQLRKERIPVREIVAGCAERVAPLAERKQIRMTLDRLPDEALNGDRELMEYAFYNLLTNAIKYSPSQTEVRVFGSRQGDELHVSVLDQGIGMDQKEVRKIFQKFYRTRKAEQSGEAGTGIGLSIVEQIILQHGGKIDVKSTPGKGSCFTLILPAAPAAAPKPIAAN